jgi:hypothetical protein
MLDSLGGFVSTLASWGFDAERVLSFALLVAVAMLLLLAVWLGLRVRRGLDRLARKTRARRASLGEQRAAILLERDGFRVIDSQAACEWCVDVDGQIQRFALRVDYLVERDGKRYVADAKTGAAASLGSASTRRQLLEYSIAYDAAGALLVDMETNRLVEVRFLHHTGSAPSRLARSVSSR